MILLQTFVSSRIEKILSLSGKALNTTLLYTLKTLIWINVALVSKTIHTIVKTELNENFQIKNFFFVWLRLNATFNNISVISRWSVLLLEEAGVPETTTDLGQVTNNPYHVRCELNATRFLWYKPGYRDLYMKFKSTCL